MGRPEKPVDRTVPARANLADFLRYRKAAADLTYKQMAAKAHHVRSKATFERAGSGASVPSLETVETAVTVTITEEELRNRNLIDYAYYRGKHLWLCARRATRAPYYVHKAPDPNLITFPADFGRALRNQHIWAGCPTPGEMARASGAWLLPPSTSRRIIAGDILPVDAQQAVAFLRACYVEEPAALGRWIHAGMRVLDLSVGAAKWCMAHDEMIELARIGREAEKDVLEAIAASNRFAEKFRET